eukprot:756978-Hanusia_phi.AAC.2
MLRNLVTLLAVVSLHGAGGDEDTHEHRGNMVIRKLPVHVRRRLEQEADLEGTDWEEVAVACLQIGREDLSQRVFSMLARMQESRHSCPAVFFSSHAWITSHSVGSRPHRSQQTCSSRISPAHHINFLQSSSSLDEAVERYAHFHSSVYLSDDPPKHTR